MSLRTDEPLCIYVRMCADRKLRALVIGQQSRFFVALEGFDTYGALLDQIARRICEPRVVVPFVYSESLQFAEECTL